MSSSATSITFLQGSQTCFFFLDKPTELGFMHTCAWYTLQSKRPNIWGLDKQGPSKTISSSVPNAQQNSVNTQTVIKLMLHTQDMGGGGEYVQYHSPISTLPLFHQKVGAEPGNVNCFHSCYLH